MISTPSPIERFIDNRYGTNGISQELISKMQFLRDRGKQIAQVAEELGLPSYLVAENTRKSPDSITVSTLKNYIYRKRKIENIFRIHDKGKPQGVFIPQHLLNGNDLSNLMEQLENTIRKNNA